MGCLSPLGCRQLKKASLWQNPPQRDNCGLCGRRLLLPAFGIAALPDSP